MQNFKRHLLFWILYVSFTVAIYYVKEPVLGLHILYELASLPAKLLLVYFTLYFILPRYLLVKRYTWALAYFFLALFATVWLLQIGVSLSVYPVYFPEVEILLIPENLDKMISPLLDLVIVSSLAVVAKLLQDREQQERDKLHLEKLNAENELRLLKSQLQPHFLFNTLNGLYACTLEDPVLASEMVVKLSDLLRFIIYEGHRPLVGLRDELQCLRNYYELEKIRYGERLEAAFTIHGSCGNKKIVPLLLLPFLENAFKHGPSKRFQSPWIRVMLKIDEKELILRLSNSKSSDEEQLHRSDGIGLRNVQQQLQHHYGDRYVLRIEDQLDQFVVALKIPLS